MLGNLLVLLMVGSISYSSDARLPTADEIKEVEKRGRQLTSEEKPLFQSLIQRGVYIPDKRFNAFVDGVMVNMIEEMKRMRLDPLYFRVSEEGNVEHVPTTKRRLSIKRKMKRQTNSALGGGVIKGLTSLRRFGDAEIQIAGNITLIRSHWLIGPLTIIVDYRGEPTITRVRTELQAVQFDTLTSVDRFGAKKQEFRLNSPLFDYMPYYGNRTLSQQKVTELVVRYLFSEASFVTRYLEDSFTVASFDRIIPQFGAGDNYYSMLQYLFSGSKGRMSRNPAIKQIMETFTDARLSGEDARLSGEDGSTNFASDGEEKVPEGSLLIQDQRSGSDLDQPNRSQSFPVKELITKNNVQSQILES